MADIPPGQPDVDKKSKRSSNRFNIPGPDERCTGHSKSAGEQCKKFKVVGQLFCKNHGGSDIQEAPAAPAAPVPAAAAAPEASVPAAPVAPEAPILAAPAAPGVPPAAPAVPEPPFPAAPAAPSAAAAPAGPVHAGLLPDGVIAMLESDVAVWEDIENDVAQIRMTQKGIIARQETMMKKLDAMNAKMDTLLDAFPVKKDARVVLPKYTTAEIEANNASYAFSM
jgi:hypothetical protein